MSDLVEFLKARIADELANVRSLAAGFDGEMWTEYSEAEARIVDLHSGPHRCPGKPDYAQPTVGHYIGCETMRLLAFDRRDDPEFRDEWLPSDLPRVVRTEGGQRDA